MQEMRTLLRTRKQLSREKSNHILRMQKTLEDANERIKSFCAAQPAQKVYWADAGAGANWWAGPMEFQPPRTDGRVMGRRE
jgi:selenocysteine lyase/cysteine desulfurase